MSGFLKLAGVVFVIFIAVWGYGIGSKANKDQSTSNNVGQYWSQIHEGMTKSEVVSLIGQPNDKTTSNVGGTEVDDWMYGTFASTTYDITFEDGTVFSYSKM